MLNIRIHADDHGTEEYDILGHTYACLPDDDDMEKAVSALILYEINHCDFTHVAADTIFDMACGTHHESLRGFISYNYKEIYMDSHGIRRTFTIFVEGVAVEVYEDE